MVSKRNFFSITIMMFVLLFLFQFSMVIRDRQNTYDVNSNFTTRQKDGKNVWKNKQIDPVAVRTTDRSYALFVGDSSSDMATAVSRWCIYAKWDMAQCRNLEDYQENDKALPGMLILESEKYALGDNLEKLEKLEQKGVIIVFGCLENPKNIEKNQIVNTKIVRLSAVEVAEALTGVREFKRLQQEQIDINSYNCDTLLIDPPRSGLEFQEARDFTAKFDHVIYVSCGPQSLVEDLGYLCKTHEIRALAFFDQFPYTPHLETIVELCRK